MELRGDDGERTRRARPPRPSPTPPALALPIALSADAPDALRARAAGWARWWAAHPAATLDAVRRAATLEPAARHRAVVLALDRAGAIAGLEALASGRPHPAVRRGEARIGGGVVFVCPGYGGQWAGMGRALLDTSPAFAEVIDACDAAMPPTVEWSLRAVLRGDPGAPTLEPTEVVVPALFAMSVGLAAVWRALGVEPGAVVGHSGGEVAAAVVAGALSLADGVRVAEVLGRQVAAVAHDGTMLAVQASPEALSGRLADDPRLELAVVNGAEASVVAGDRAALEALRAALDADGIVCRRVPIRFAAHTAFMDEALAPIAAELTDLCPRSTPIAIYSPTTGGAIDGAALGPDFWPRLVRSVVRFDRALGALGAAGYTTFVELGGHAVLAGAARDALGGRATTVDALRHGEGGLDRLVAALGALYVAGHRVDWRRLNGPGPVAPLPAPGEGDAPPIEVTDDPAVGVTVTVIRQLAAELLGRADADAVPADAPLTELGLDSLSGLELRNRLSARFGVRLAPTAALRAPTPIALAALVAAAEPLARVAAPRSSGAPMPRTAPLAPNQARLAFLDGVLARPETYNMQVAMRVEAALDPGRLQQALDHQIARYDQLRMHLVDGPDGPRQRIVPWVDVPIEAVDLADRPDPDAALAALAAERGRRPFDLRRAPLLRVTLARLGPTASGLVVVWHHIAGDGASVGHLVAGLSAGYRALGEGPLPPPTAAPDYGALCAAQALSPAATEAHRRFWADHLADAEPLALPLDRPRGGAPRGAIAPLTLDPALSAAIDRLAAATRTSPFAVLATGWALVLGRAAGGVDPCVGVIASGRTAPGAEDAVGFFVRTLPVRFGVGEGTVSAAVAANHRRVLGAIDHQQLPLAEILAAGPALDRSVVGEVDPLLRASVVLEDAAWFGAAFADAPSRLCGPSISGDVEDTAKFDLALALLRGEAGYRGTVQYRADLFDPATVERLCARVSVALAAMVAAPACPVAEVALVTADERRLLAAWSDTAAPEPAPRWLPALVAAQAARTPDATAVVFEGEAVSFAVLHGRIHRLAWHLRGLGVRPGVYVAVAVERGVERVVALHAVVMAGGAYVPIELDLPPARARMMVDDCGAALLLTAGAEAARWRDGRTPLVSLDDAPPPPPSDALPPGGGPDDPIYAIYTSGSTGRPKAAVNTHRALANRLRWMQAEMPLSADDVVVQKTPYGFDVSVWELFWPLIVGARLVVAPPHAHKDPHALAALFASAGVTTAHFVPSMLAALIASGASLRGAPLRRVICSGEALGAELRDAFFARSDAALYNLYGPTEAAIDVTCWRCVRGAGSPTVPIGRPIANVQARVLDPAGGACGVGQPGELHLAGVQVGLGYLGRPALTAERFVPDPHGPPGARMYRTGDRCRHRPDGAIEFLGRLDFQVKIRGLRIEPGGVEAALATHPAVRQCVVVARADGGEQALVAYLVGERRPVAALREHLAASLPAHMIPAAFVYLDALPLTPNGKVDRRALPAPALDRAALSAGFVKPRTPTEDALARIWAEVLGLDAVGARDDFFELGGHSLRATRIASRIAATLGARVSLRALFEARTVAAQARLVDRAERAAVDPIERVDRAGRLPLSFAQEGLWFLHRLDPDSVAHNMPLSLWLRGPLDLGALTAALDRLVARHEALRTTLPADAEGPRQHIAPPAPIALCAEPVADLDALRRRLHAAARRPFDLAAGPLFRVRLWRLDAETHALMLDLHHAVFDGWSMGLALRELAEAYAAHAAGAPLPTTPPALDYADYAAWQRRRLDDAALGAQLAWWRARLADAPTLALPTDHPRPATPSRRGATVPVPLDPGVMAAVDARARQAGVTPFMILLAAYGAVLARHAGQDEVVVGTPVASRDRRALEGMIGMFVDPVALRLDLRGDPTVAALLDRVRATTADAHAHRVPFEQVVDALGLPRDPSRTPLFQVWFALSDATFLDVERMGPLRVEPIEHEAAGAKFDLQLAVGAGPRGATAALHYATDLFERTTVERFATHLARAVAAIAGDPDRRLSAIEMLPTGERRWLRAAGDGARPAVDPRPLPARFAERARRTPDAVAVVGPDETLSCGALLDRADALARRLRRAGVGPEVRVGLCLERSAEWVVAMLAVLRAGGAWVPLDPAYPAARLRFMVADAAPAVVITRSTVTLDLGAAARIDLDRPAPADATEGASAPVAVELDHPAYVVYTSGSTGRPKGVVGLHRGLVHRVDWALTAFGFGPDAVASWRSSPSFVTTVFEIWAALIGEVPLVVVPEDLAHDPAAMLGWLARHGVTHLAVAPGLLRGLLDALDAGAPRPPLRRVRSGAELLPVALARRFFATLPGCRLAHMFGSSEVSSDCSAALLPGPDVPPVMPLGAPLHHTRLSVVGPAATLCPAGAPGELWVGGAHLARGYLGRPALTAERFVPDPFGPPGARAYRTGDRCRRRADGALEFLGRLDFQVNIRGFRVEIGEVEAALAAHPAVRVALVVARRDDGETRLVAYLVGDRAPLAALRRHLEARLPAYMVPAAVVWLDALPRTPNGKVDRRALPAPALDRAALSAAFVAPRTPTERALAPIWAEVLGLDAIGADDDFFELGGHSLRLTRVASRISARLGVEVPLRALFEATTLAAQARLVDAAEAAAPTAAPTPAPLDRADRTGRIPPSFAQARLWFLDRLAPGTAEYSLPIALRLRGPLDVDALAAALSAVVARHEALRTTLPADEHGPWQRITPPRPLALPAVAVADEAALRAHLADALARPFDLAGGPLVRAHLWRLAVDEHVWLLNAHHAVLDGWSIGLVLRELADAYATSAAGGRPDPSPPPLDYADYAVWQRRRLVGAALERHLDWWRTTLADAPPLELPTDHPRPAVRTARGARLDFDPGPLDALARAHGVTPFMALLAAYALVLARHGGHDEVVIGAPVAHRGEAFEGVVGCFVNTLPLRVDLGGDPTAAALLARARRLTLDAHAHQDAPFDKIVEALGVPRDPSRTPVFQAMLVLQNAPLGPLALGAVEVEPLDTARSIAKFDLTLTAVPTADGLRAELDYSVDLFARETAARLAAHLRLALTAMAADPAQRLSAVTLSTADERRRIAGWNDTARPVRGGCLHDLFAEHARRAPDADAVVFEDEAISYGALAARAHRLAQRLVARGVGPEVRVGLCLPRSIDMLVAILAVLEAGGCYVPLDPTHPPARLRFMARDAEVAVVLTHRATPPSWPATAARIDLDAPLDDPRPARPLGPRAAPEHLAYIIYTSGSTGRPKGVGVTHRAAVNQVEYEADLVGIAPGESVLQFASFGFDGSVSQAFSALCRGARLLVASERLRRSPPALGDWLAAERADVANIPPTVVALLEEHQLATVRLLMVGAEACPVELAVRFGPGRRFMNSYGPTETTIAVCYYEEPQAPGSTGTFALGRPSANHRVHVLTPALTPAPLGGVGELYIAGEGVARGYLGRPALTAERFLPDPHGPPGARMYRTGDRGRWRPDGQLEFLGRVDHQIKIRGFRVEAGEVEDALSRHPAVRRCAVIARREGDDTRLVAYLVGEPAPLAALRDHLAETLPDYMIPWAFVWLDALPLTPNGKLDRAALPAPTLDRDTLSAGYAAPATPTERALAAIWAEVLGLERVGVHDDFFELGGHSILSVRAVTRATRAGLPLTPRLLFERPTIAALAAHLDGGASTGIGAVRLRGAGAEAPLVLIPPLAGTSLVFGPLVDALRPTLPVWAVDDPIFDGAPGPATVDALAAAWIERLDATRPRPAAWRLAGYSFGGMVAVEIARQLRARGEGVERVLVIDGGLPTPGAPFDRRALIDELAAQLGVLAPRDGDPLAALAAAFGGDAKPEAGARRWVDALLAAAEANHARQARWRVRPTDAPITVLSAARGRARGGDPGWAGALERPVDVIPVAGDHAGMMRPPLVRNLALCIEACLGPAESRRQPPSSASTVVA